MADIAVIYCRVSDPNKPETAGELAQQEQECRKYAAAHGMEVLRAVRDTYTGTKLERVKFWECVDDIKYGRANTILIYAYDRLSRGGSMHVSYIKREVQQSG